MLCIRYLTGKFSYVSMGFFGHAGFGEGFLVGFFVCGLLLFLFFFFPPLFSN